MDASESIVFEHLRHRGFLDIDYEPDGNVPPDFLVDGRIAVEVRRLNQNEVTEDGYKGLEERAVPLASLVNRVLRDMGSPLAGTSWFVDYTFSRPLPPLRQLTRVLKQELAGFLSDPTPTPRQIQIAARFEIEFFPAAHVHETAFVPAGCLDHDAGGFVIAELAHNLNLCLSEKSAKVARFLATYPEWWLVLVDRISYGTAADDLPEVRRLVTTSHPFNKVILVSPIEPAYSITL